MTVARQLAIVEDPYAYATNEVDGYNIAGEYQAASGDWIDYQHAAFGTSSVYRVLRMNSHDERVSRETIIEESTDQVAAASLFGGIYNASGSFSGAFRGWDFHLSGLMKGIMGYQTPVVVQRPGGDTDNISTAVGYKYELTMVPATLSVKIVDEQAVVAAGTRGSTTVYRGVGIMSAEFTLAAKQYTMINCQWMARRAEVFDVGYNSVNEPSGDPALFYNAVLKWTPENGTQTSFKCQQFTMSINRPIDQDDYLIGSQFLANLSYNGITDLGGSITLSATDWDKTRAMIAGSTDTGIDTLDEGKKEYFGEVTGGATPTTTVLANAIPAGKLEIYLHSPDGSRVVSRIIAYKCKLTEATRSAQGRQKFAKSLTWKAQLNNTDKFTFEVFNPANNDAGAAA